MDSQGPLAWTWHANYLHDDGDCYRQQVNSSHDLETISQTFYVRI